MAAPTIPASNSQAVLTVQAGGTIPFAQQWYTFFANLLAYVSTGPIGPVPLVGVTDGSSAAAGNIGEYIASLVPVSPGLALTTTASRTITSVTLTAGDWDVWGEVNFGQASGSTITYAAAALWNTAASVGIPLTAYPADGTAPADFGQISTGGGAATANGPTIVLGPMRANLTSNLTLFLSANSTFGASTLVAGGAIRARRRR